MRKCRRLQILPLSSSDAGRLQHSSLVSALWHCASDSHELWTHFLEDADFDSDDTIDIVQSKRRYRALLESNVRTAVLEVAVDQLAVFSCIECKCTKSLGNWTSLMLDRWTFAVFTTNAELLVCGGTSDRQSAVLHYSDGRDSLALPNILHLRICPSFILYHKAVYVFGGMAVSTSAERLDLVQKRWSELPSMLSHHSDCTAAVHRRRELFRHFLREQQWDSRPLRDQAVRHQSRHNPAARRRGVAGLVSAM